jgi:hypothetical protein
MILPVRWLQSITAQNLHILFKLRKVLIGLITIGLGILLGYLHSSSPETAELTISILVIFIQLLIIINKPLNGLLVLFMIQPFIDGYIEIDLGTSIPDLSFSRFTIAFLFILMFARAATGKFRFATPVSLTEICIIATAIGIASSAPLAKDPNTWIRDVIDKYFTPLMMYFFARNLVRDREELHKLLCAFVIFGLGVAIYAIYEQSTGHILFVGDARDVSSLNIKYTEHLRMIRGLLGRPGNFARVFLSTIPVAFYLLFEHKSVIRKILLAGVLVVQFCAMFLTYNRTSWYALMIGLFILQFFYPQFRKVYIVMVLVAAIVLWATWDQVNESAVVSERIGTHSSGLEKREVLWQAGYNMWRAKPIRGWGANGFEEESGRFRTDGGRTNLGGNENDYLRIMVSSGLIGFLPYLIFLLTPLFHSIRLFFKARAPDWPGFIKPETIAIYWVAIICYAIGSYTQNQNVLMVKVIPFAMAGAIVGTHQHWLCGLKKRSAPKLLPTTAKVEMG